MREIIIVEVNRQTTDVLDALREPGSLVVTRGQIIDKAIHALLDKLKAEREGGEVAGEA